MVAGMENQEHGPELLARKLAELPCEGGHDFPENAVGGIDGMTAKCRRCGVMLIEVVRRAAVDAAAEDVEDFWINGGGDMNYKRKKPRTQVRCSACTPIRKRMNGKRDDGLIAGKTRVRQGKKFWPAIEKE